MIQNKIMKKSNPRTGSNFDDFLKEEGIYDEVTAKALKRAISEQLKDGLAAIDVKYEDYANEILTQPKPPPYTSRCNFA